MRTAREMKFGFGIRPRYNPVIAIMTVMVALAICGCERTVRPAQVTDTVKGQVVSAGRPVTPPEGKFVFVVFVPASASEDRSRVRQAVCPAGTADFTITGDVALLPGEYRIVLFGRGDSDSPDTDIFNNQFTYEKTPFRFKMEAGLSQDLTIDVDTKTIAKK